MSDEAHHCELSVASNASSVSLRRAFEAELHRVRGEMLLQRDPASIAPAEEAFQTAIAVAKQQATRNFELRAALALAKLYQSTGRPAGEAAEIAFARVHVHTHGQPHSDVILRLAKG